MKVLMINGSTHAHGCTYTAMSEIGKVLMDEGIEYEIVNLGTAAVRDCTACWNCSKMKNSRCVFDDDIVNEIIEKAEKSDGFVFGTPVYFAHPTGTLLSVLDRVFYAGGRAFYHKPGVAVASARRAGTTASLDVINKYFGISQMPIVASTYWNMVHGSESSDVEKDLEGLQTMHNIGKNMAWLMKCIENGKVNGIELPKTKKAERTNFIR